MRIASSVSWFSSLLPEVVPGEKIYINPSVVTGPAGWVVNVGTRDSQHVDLRGVMGLACRCPGIATSLWLKQGE